MCFRLYKINKSQSWYVDLGVHNGKRIRLSTDTDDKTLAEMFAKYQLSEYWRIEREERGRLLDIQFQEWARHDPVQARRMRPTYISNEQLDLVLAPRRKPKAMQTR